jgi:hypothetical protein
VLPNFGSRMRYDLTHLQSDVAQVQHNAAGFGSGRLIATNLILTAAHVLSDKAAPELEGWEVRLAGDRSQDAWRFRHDNRVLWYDQVLDLALIEIVDPEGGPLRPRLRLRVATITGNNAHAVEARGYPRASRESDGPRVLTPARGDLTAGEANEPLRFGVHYSDLPDEPHRVARHVRKRCAVAGMA